MLDQVADMGDPGLHTVAALLGGSRALGHRVSGPLDAHDMLLDGIPGAAFLYLVGHLSTLQKSPSFERAVGMSLRTMQRRKDSPLKRLSPEQSGRTWKFAEILARTTRMLGSQEEAELWLAKPQMGLDGRRPIDLMATPAGIEMLETFICRLEYGVYT